MKDYINQMNELEKSGSGSEDTYCLEFVAEFDILAMRSIDSSLNGKPADFFGMKLMHDYEKRKQQL